MPFWGEESEFRVFQKELYNFESLYKFIQKTCAMFRTVIMQQNTLSFVWESCD
jgi:hypothetical protein